MSRVGISSYILFSLFFFASIGKEDLCQEDIGIMSVIYVYITLCMYVFVSVAASVHV